MNDKPFHTMTDDELRAAHKQWSDNTDKASGWPSVYFAAKQLEAICIIGKHRGLDLENQFPITIGIRE